MSKIIYRKVRTAPGVKQYLDEEKTQVNPEFETKSGSFKLYNQSNRFTFKQSHFISSRLQSLHLAHIFKFLKFLLRQAAERKK